MKTSFTYSQQEKQEWEDQVRKVVSRWANECTPDAKTQEERQAQVYAALLQMRERDLGRMEYISKFSKKFIDENYAPKFPENVLEDIVRKKSRLTR